MKILFCDDDPKILQQLQNYVSEYFQSNHLKEPEFCCYSSGDEVIEKQESADIAFVDVEMPGENGIQVGAYLQSQNAYTKIMIVTAYPDYLDEAMRFHVFRYLSKPIDKDRLFRNLADALYQLNIETKKIIIETPDGDFVYPSDKIVCLEKENRKTVLYTTNAVYYTTSNIDQWRKKLDLPCFYNPYRSFIINMKYVSSFNKDSITLKYGQTEKIAYLARRRYKDFKTTYLLYLGGITP